MNTDDQIKLAQAQLIQHTAEQMGIDVNTLSTEDLAKFASHVLAEAGASEEERELETKVAEADALGRMMARSFLAEQEKIAQDAGLPAYADNYDLSYGTGARRGALVGGLAGGLSGLAAGYPVARALGANPGQALLAGSLPGLGAAASGALTGAAVGAGVQAARRALMKRYPLTEEELGNPVEQKVASALGNIQNFWAMKIAEEMAEEEAKEEEASAEGEEEAAEEAMAEEEAKEAMFHLANALYAHGKVKTAGAVTKALFQSPGTDYLTRKRLAKMGYSPTEASDLVQQYSTGPSMRQAVLGAASQHAMRSIGDVIAGDRTSPVRAGLGIGVGTVGGLGLNSAVQSKFLADRINAQALNDQAIAEAAKQASAEFAKLAEARAAEIMAANGIHPETFQRIAPTNVKIAHVVTPDHVGTYQEKVAAAQFNEHLNAAAVHILQSIGLV
jgi:hypothetical protein